MSVLLLCVVLLQGVDVLVERLGSESIADRWEAVEELVRRGLKAVPDLEKASKSGNPEVELRAREALVRIRSGGLFDGRGGADPEVEAALAWLARRQGADGAWDHPEPGTKVGVTGLALLAILGAGRGADDLRYGEVVRKGLERLKAWQDADGCVGSRGGKHMYGHAIGALALAEGHAFGGLEELKGPAQRAVDFTLAAQTPGRGWRYAAGCGESDTSVTFWVLVSLGVARRAGLRVPAEPFAGARAWLSEVTEEAYGRVGYVSRFSKCRTSEPRSMFDAHESMTGAGLVLRRLLGEPSTAPAAESGLQLLDRDRPSAATGETDYYYWHTATLGLFHAEGPEGRRWRAWQAALRKAASARQIRHGPEAGSWEQADKWSQEAGPVYATAITALTLETPRRYRAIGGIARPR